MKPWILNEFITSKEKEILKITLLSAGYELSKSVDIIDVGITDGFISIHKDYPKRVCEDRRMIKKVPIKYKELIFRLREEIKNQVHEDS